MEVIEFRDAMLDEVHLNASVNGTSAREEFLTVCSNMLIDAEEFVDFNFLSFEGVGARNKRIQIDGYFFDELDDCLSIVICPFSDNLEIISLTRSEAERIFGRAIAFVEESMSGFITTNAEESSPGYGLAIDIQNRYKSVASYKFYVITDMLMSSKLIEVANSLVCTKPASFNIWDISRLWALKESKSGKEDIVIDLTAFVTEGIPCLLANGTEEYSSYLCNIPGKILADLYNTFGGRLLEGNVRSFLTARGKVNKGIRNTILNNPSMFFAYNNGIAATAYSVRIIYYGNVPHITEITALQIVNGGQTTASLAMALINDKDRANGLANIFVPMKLSVVSPEKADELIPNISRYANSQNKVSDADLSANHPFHIRIEDFSRRIITPAVNGSQYGTHWYYERAKGQYNQEQAKMTNSERTKFALMNPKSQVFTKTELAKYITIIRLMPQYVCLGAQKNYMKFAEWAFEEEKGQWVKDEAQFNEAYFKKTIALAILFKQVDKLVKTQEWYELGYKAQVVSYTLAKFLYEVQTQFPDMVFDYKSIWNKQEVPVLLQKELVTIAELMYSHLVSVDREVQNVTEWAKRESCWKKAQSIRVSLSLGFKDFLIDKYCEHQDEKDAKHEQRAVNRVTAMIDVANFGVENWKKLHKWGESTKVLNPAELSFIRVAIAMEQGNFPSEKQSIKIMQILDRAREESYPG